MRPAPDDFAQHMEVVARALLGEPNKFHSKPGRPRWGNKGSLAIDEGKGTWFDHENQVGGGVLALVEREKRITGTEAKEWLASIGCHLNGASKPRTNGAIVSARKQKLIEAYDYTDVDGALVLQVRRMGFLVNGNLQLGTNGKPEKTFQQRRPDPGELGVWIWGMSPGEYMRKGPGLDWYRFNPERFERLPPTRQRRSMAAAKSIPYRLPELAEAIAAGQPVFIVEGEKKVDALAQWNLRATCNAEGAGKWSAVHAEHLRGANVVVLPDNDDRGRSHAEQVTRSLAGIAAHVRIVDLPGLPPKGDVVDWQAQGRTREELDALLDRAAQQETPDSSIGHNSGPALDSVRADAIQMTAVDWLWPGRFAIGKLGIIAGLPDEGKGQILCEIAARVTRGEEWPCNEGTAPQGNVILLTAEDDLADTVAPRLAAAGADLSRIHIVKMVRDNGRSRMFSLIADLELLRRKIQQVGDVRAIQIDPISAYMGVGKIDSYRTTDVRAVLGPLVDLAAECKVAIIGILHFNKKVDINNALLRISDSLAYGATARHVYGVVNDSENKRKLFVRAKNNLAVAADKALAYSFGARAVGTDAKSGAEIWAPHIVWSSQYVDVTAAEAMQAASESRSPAARDDAKKFLTEILAAGPVSKKDIEEAADANGISARTLHRAKSELGINAKKDGSGGSWRWHAGDR